ncbi:MAG: response regulator transcription factor [Actinomycetales bacterium]
MTSILVAEDEQRIASFIDKGLRANGFGVTVVGDGQAAYQAAVSGAHDLLVLDIGLPLLDGFAVLGRLRRAGSALPVIILTARTGVGDTVAGLESGADDYMPKPFRFEELLARIRLRLRSPASPVEPTVLRYGDLALDTTTRRAIARAREVDLSSREFALLEMLLRHAGQVLSREQILSRVWGYDFDPGSNVVDVYIRYLRRKVGSDWIETVRGVGYRLRDPGRHPA